MGRPLTCSTSPLRFSAPLTSTLPADFNSDQAAIAATLRSHGTLMV